MGLEFFRAYCTYDIMTWTQRPGHYKNEYDRMGLILQMVRMLRTARRMTRYINNLSRKEIFIREYLCYVRNPLHDLGQYIREVHMLWIQVGQTGTTISQRVGIDHLIMTLPLIGLGLQLT